MEVDPDSPPSALRPLTTVVRGLAFWAAILLPMVYLPLLLVGWSRVTDPTVLGALVFVNGLAIVLGQDYEGDVHDLFRRLS